GSGQGSELLPEGSAAFDVLVNSFERELIVEALKKNNGNMSAAGRGLSLSPRVMHYKINKLNINPDWYTQDDK
ncbi:MAG: helix-turn-helix domain-containing protein, partial [Victivallaceae bacterium]